MSESNIWYLENIDARGIFCSNKVDHDAHGVRHDTYAKGDYIFKQRDAANQLYFITSGRVKIGVNGVGEKTVTKAILNEGEIFGEKVITGQSRRNDFAQALEATEVCVISREEMSNLFRDHNPLYLFIMQLIGQRALKMEKRLESLVFKDSRTRIVEFLIDLKNERGERVGYEWVVRNFITHQEIANLTATSRQTVTTVLNELKAREILTFNRKRLLIRDIDILSAEVSDA
jgi:CRP/FNR family transcriptional regulator, cyclic AMP receptor protein